MDKSLQILELDKCGDVSEKILSIVLKSRRTFRGEQSCKTDECKECTTLHLEKIRRFVNNRQPIVFVLPAFPGKSPNKNKVLSPRPDCAEDIALDYLAGLCDKISVVYKPGAKVIICSDGRVFSDVVGMKEPDVTLYQSELSKTIANKGYDCLMTYNLDDHYGDLSFENMRTRLMNTYSQSLEQLKLEVKRGAKTKAAQDEREANHMYKGITRFMFEDSMVPGFRESKTALQKAAKKKAYEVIRRSNAWSDLIAEKFSECVRLSIHPQPCGSKKLGIRLVGNESWMTPWHGVAVLTPRGPMLLKKSEAEALGAELIYDESGRESHYRLTHVGVLYEN